MQTPVYLDYAATTPVDPQVAEQMMQCLTMDGNFANPASRSHLYGWKAEEAVEGARAQLADLLNADPREIVWTSGATESTNLALKGLAAARKASGRHIVTSMVEHRSVLDTCASLEQQGFEVTYLKPSTDGLIMPEQVAEALRSDTILASFMHVNNEVGVINDIVAIGELCRSRGVALHVDAAQSAGKLPLDMAAMPVDLLSISAHKLYGPKGVGMLYVRRSPDIAIEAQMHGGGHERGLRSGTLPTHQLVGLGEAARLAQAGMDEEQERIGALRDRFWQGVRGLSGVSVNGSMSQRVAGNLNLSFADVDGENLLIALRDLAVSTGSACTSVSIEPSYVLKAMGVSDALANSALRFSFGRFTTEAEIDFAIDKVCSVINKLRQQNGSRSTFIQSA